MPYMEPFRPIDFALACLGSPQSRRSGYQDPDAGRCYEPDRTHKTVREPGICVRPGPCLFPAISPPRTRTRSHRLHVALRTTTKSDCLRLR